MKSANKGLYLSIPTPCTENRDAMNSTGQGKCCASCNKHECLIVKFVAQPCTNTAAIVNLPSFEVIGEETRRLRMRLLVPVYVKTVTKSYDLMYYSGKRIVKKRRL